MLWNSMRIVVIARRYAVKPWTLGTVLPRGLILSIPRTLAAAIVLSMAIGSVNAEDRGFIFPRPGSPPFDFSDAFYYQNGIDPLNVRDRVNGSDGVSVLDQP